jgi:hypothetical protein
LACRGGPENSLEGRRREEARDNEESFGIFKNMKSLKYIALFGDVIYILWIVYNAIDEGFKSIRSVEAVALIGLVILLALNIFLLRKK